MSRLQFSRVLLLSLAALAAAALGDEQQPTTTVTIPYIGTCTTSTTVFPCDQGTVTVVIETPLETPECTTTNTKTHSTPSATPTPGGPCLTRPSCPAQGLNIDYYHNPFGGYSRIGQIPSSYYITQNLSPLKSSFTNVTFFPQDRAPNLPTIFPDPTLPGVPYYVGWTRNTNGGIVVDANNFTLVYQGFYRAPVTGRYALCTTADNENDIFFGHGNAFSCLTGRPDPAAKPLAISTGGNFVNGINCTNVDMQEGLFYPVRNVMGDWQGPSAFNFTIKRPDGRFEDRTNDFTGRAYPHDCGSLF